MNYNRRRVRFLETFWFVPAVYNAAALVLVAVMVGLDYSVTTEMAYAGAVLLDVDLAADLLSTLAAAILTMTAITFSSIMVVLTTYSTQFSPRVLQNFMADGATQHVLALFSSGFTFSVTAMVFMNSQRTDDVIFSPVTGVLFGLVAIGAFVYFIHHTAVWAQVNNLGEHIAERTAGTIRRVTERELWRRREPIDDADRRCIDDPGARTVAAPTSGYIVFMDLETLAAHAREDDLTVVVDFPVGGYVVEGVRMLRLCGGGAAAIDPDRYQDCVLFGNEQTDEQDIAFGLRKLVEIALRAISPSINDPYTAATCLHRMAPLLTMLAQRDRGHAAVHDEDGALRLVTRDFSFEDYLSRALQEIRFYGRSDLTVAVTLLDVLALVAQGSAERFHEVLWRFGADAASAYAETAATGSGRAHVRQRLQALARVTGQRPASDAGEVL